MIVPLRLSALLVAALIPGIAPAATVLKRGPSSDIIICEKVGKTCEYLLRGLDLARPVGREVIDPEPFDDDAMVARMPDIRSRMPEIRPPLGEE